MSYELADKRGSCCEIGPNRTRAGILGILSALFASACCGLPLLFIALGLGGLGFGAFLGKYHWYFTAAGLVLLGAAWFVFSREKTRLREAGSEIRSARFTSVLLALATLTVIGFAALNLASALGLGAKAHEVAMGASGSCPERAEVVLPVEGMTCVTCEWAVEKALGKLGGVVEVKASSSEGKVLVRYEPARVTLERMVDAINATGYKVSIPES